MCLCSIRTNLQTIKRNVYNQEWEAMCTSGSLKLDFLSAFAASTNKLFINSIMKIQTSVKLANASNLNTRFRTEKYN